MRLLFERLLKPLPVGLLHLVFLTLLVLQLSIPALVLPQQQTSPIHSAKRILVLYTYGDGQPAYRKASDAFWPVITGGGVSPDDIFSEYLDLNRNNSAEYRQRLANLLRYKYAMREIWLIVTVHNGALEFLLEECKGLFPDAPVLSYLTFRPELIEAKNTGRRILLRPQNQDMGGTLEIALKMFPQTRKVVFVTGTATADWRFQHEARRIFEPWRDKMEFEYTSDRSLEEILQLVASLPPRSIVIYSNVFSDKTGRTFAPLEVGKMVAKAANAPVFCLWDTIMGSGPIGGSLLSFEAEGAYAGNKALEILNGKILLTKAVTTLPSAKTFMFDWRQLRRWGVNESILPKGSIVVNRPRTIWGEYRGFVIGGVAVFLVQTLLVIGLLVQRNLRRKAESSVKELNLELEHRVEERTLQLRAINEALENEITERKRLEEELRRSRDELEVKVQERTTELAKANKELQEEMAKGEKTEEQLRQAQKLESIGTLTGGIAHDFNNILGAIVLNSEMALSDLPKESVVRSNLELILNSGIRGKDLVRQMLLFSRKSEKRQEIVTLSRIIKETFQLLKSAIPATIQMKLLLETESDAVYGDPSQIQQVIMNLCTNAAYAMRGTTGSIHISLQGITFGSMDLPQADIQPGEYLVLSVKDTGSGMDEEVRKRIFEPFFTTKPVGEGTGLGLSVAYGIVKNHKGNITVYSEPGKGSIFRVYLPKADTGVSVQTETLRPIPKGNERILLVDDEETMINSVRKMLENLGYKVTARMDSREALKLFSANPSQFDLVITDQTMPFMTGEDLGKEIMRLRPDIPVILCTGYSDLISSKKATAMGFRGFIMKPFTVREGAESVRRVLDQNRIEKPLGTQFVSEPSISSAVKADDTRVKAALTPADLSILNADWLKEFFQTMKKGRSKQLLNLIEQIRPEHADLARGLAELVRIHQYEKLIPLTREALKENANG